MSSSFGNSIKFSVFGQSHGQAVGVVVDRFPAGEFVDVEALKKFLALQRPGQSKLTTSRQEAGDPIILSGLNEHGTTCGAQFCAIIENKDAHSGDYADFSRVPRPGHADYTAILKY